MEEDDDIVVLPIEQLHVRVECPAPAAPTDTASDHTLKLSDAIHEFACQVTHAALDPIQPIPISRQEEEVLRVDDTTVRYSLTLQDMPALRGVKMSSLRTDRVCTEWLSQRAYKLEPTINKCVSAFGREQGYRGDALFYFGMGNVEEEEATEPGESAATLVGVLTLSLVFSNHRDEGQWSIDV